MIKYNYNSPKSILDYAKKIQGKTLQEICGPEIIDHSYSGKGNFGQLLEKFYFGYEPNSVAEPDFEEAGMELKTTPLKVLKDGSFRSKERLVLNIINYMKVHKETFKESSFWKKNAHLLLIFYLPQEGEDLLNYLISLVGEWKFPPEDLEIIQQDWKKIQDKIRAGKAHEISEGDTFYLGACTKGSKGGNVRQQPFNEALAPQRAYSLKQGYVNHIIAHFGKNEEGSYGKVLDHSKTLDLRKISLEDIIISHFQPFYGKTPQEIEASLGLALNQKSKSYFASLTRAILGVPIKESIEEFEKAEIEVKTVRLNENNLPKEAISFPTFKYEEIIKEDWENSELKSVLEKKFLFIFYKYQGEALVLIKVKFWNMSYPDIQEMRKLREKTIQSIRKGNIVKEVKNDRRISFFQKESETNIGHVRPHARNKHDTYPLPYRDKLTGTTTYTKHCFWLNKNYIKRIFSV